MDVSARYDWRSDGQKDMGGEGKKMQMADVRECMGQAGEIVVCGGGVQDSGEAAFFAGVVLVQLGLCAKMIDEVLQFVRGWCPRVGVGGGQFVREISSVKRVCYKT